MRGPISARLAELKVARDVARAASRVASKELAQASKRRKRLLGLARELSEGDLALLALEKAAAGKGVKGKGAGAGKGKGAGAGKGKGAHAGKGKGADADAGKGA